MNVSQADKLTAKIIGSLLGFVTVFVYAQSVTDPVNVTKLFALGGFAFAAFGSAYSGGRFKNITSNKTALYLISLFLISALFTLFTSKAPFTQSFYGVYGRNNGFLLYFLLILSFLATISMESIPLFKYLIYALIFSGVINLAYGLWIVAFGDFIPWNNIYGGILGTFGNPNFSGSFFGMFSSILFACAFSKEIKFKYRAISVLCLPIVFFVIMRTHAVQGKVLFLAGFSITFFFFLRDHFKSLKVDAIYIFLGLVGFFLALFGTLQKGPLASILYKETVSLRGQYWFAGWQTGVSNPFHGAGFDSYGDWYRQSRRESALTFPGIDTVSNAAHNVYLDLFSFGGWPLFISYIMLNLYIVIRIFQHLQRQRKFDIVFVTFVSTWVCYQLQSIISINQIGLAIWGWIFGAAIIAYTEKNLHEHITHDVKIKKKTIVGNRSKGQIISPHLVSGLAAVVGLLVAVPPLSADMKWRSAQLSRDVVVLEATLKPSYMNPPNTFEYANVVGVLETNGFYELAHKYALESVKFNPNSFELWRNFSQLKLSSSEEKQIAIQNMKRLDPNNKNIGTTV